MPPQRIDDKRGEAKEDHLTAQVPGLANTGIKIEAEDVAVSQMSPPILFTGFGLTKSITLLAIQLSTDLDKRQVA